MIKKRVDGTPHRGAPFTRFCVVFSSSNRRQIRHPMYHRGRRTLPKRKKHSPSKDGLCFLTAAAMALRLFLPPAAAGRYSQRASRRRSHNPRRDAQRLLRQQKIRDAKRHPLFFWLREEDLRRPPPGYEGVRSMRMCFWT